MMRRMAYPDTKQMVGSKSGTAPAIQAAVNRMAEKGAAPAPATSAPKMQKSLPAQSAQQAQLNQADRQAALKRSLGA